MIEFAKINCQMAGVVPHLEDGALFIFQHAMDHDLRMLTPKIDIFNI
jgi:hypothetical protein